MDFIVNGRKLKILFTFKIDEKEYIAYMDQNDSVSASILQRNNDGFDLVSITDDDEWKKVEAAISERL